MANYSVLKAAVQAVVKTNGNQEITGANMQSTLISIINSLGTGYQFMGVATPSTSPGTQDYNVAYIGGAGTYANFGTSITVPVGSICVVKYNGSWVKEQIALFAGIDDVPTANSNNLVKSGGVAPMVRCLIGNNNTVYKLPVPLVPSHTYQISFNNPNWDTSGVTATSVYLFDVTNFYNSTSTVLLFVPIPASGVIPTIDKTYTFTVPDNSDYVSIEARATLGERVYFTLEDITSEQAVKDRMWSRHFTGKGDSWVFDEIVGLKQGRKYRFVLPKQSWDETGLTGSARFQIQSVINGVTNNLISKSLPTDAYYDITVPTSAEYDVHIRTSNKAAKDVVVNYYIYDITEISDIYVIGNDLTDLQKYVGNYFNGATSVTGTSWLLKFSTIAGKSYTIQALTTNAHDITTYLMTGTSSATRVQTIGTLSQDGTPITFTSNQNTTYIGGYTQDASVGVSIIQLDSLSSQVKTLVDGGSVSSDEILARTFNASYHTGAQNFKVKCQSFTDLVNNSSASESFMFFTDPHFFTRNNDVWEKRMPEFIAEMQKYYNSTPTSFCVSGGDWLTAQDSDSVAKFRLGYADGIMRSMFDNYYPLFGNHDDNYQGASTDGGTAATATPLETQTIINLWFRKFGKAYYTFTGAHTRFYVFDTGRDWTSGMTDYRWEQVDWFANKLLNGSDEHIAILAHIAYNTATDVTNNTLFSITDNVAQVAQAFNNRTSITLNGITYNFSNSTGVVEFILAGHVHADVSQNKYGLPIICTINTMALTTEPSFDLIYADYVARKLYCIRVGSGTDRTINLP